MHLCPNCFKSDLELNLNKHSFLTYFCQHCCFEIGKANDFCCFEIGKANDFSKDDYFIVVDDLRILSISFPSIKAACKFWKTRMFH